MPLSTEYAPISLQDKNSGKRFWVFNTHFDHKGVEARKKSAALIIKKIREINKEDLPVFLMGDFNLTPDQSPIKYIAGKLNDSKTISKQLPFGPDETFNGFKVCENRDRRIDYIFVSPKNITVKKYGVLANVKKMKYPSDHFPVYISAEIK
jgi:endonuclease/exonuclease/phosphatase family metal-dependent hydrolase